MVRATFMTSEKERNGKRERERERESKRNTYYGGGPDEGASEEPFLLINRGAVASERENTKEETEREKERERAGAREWKKRKSRRRRRALSVVSQASSASTKWNLNLNRRRRRCGHSGGTTAHKLYYIYLYHIRECNNQARSLAREEEGGRVGGGKKRSLKKRAWGREEGRERRPRARDI